MNKCNKCESTNIKQKSDSKYHDIFECITCENWTYKKTADCCRNPHLIVAQDHKYTTQTRLYEQCINCGGCVNRTKPLSFKTHGHKCEREFSNSSFDNWRNEVNEEGKTLSDSKKQYNYLNSPYYKYQLYLTSPEWRDKRVLALQRDNNICQDCKMKSADEVHHLTYDNLFNEPLEDLKSLCGQCHKAAHNKTLPEFIGNADTIKQNVIYVSLTTPNSKQA